MGCVCGGEFEIVYECVKCGRPKREDFPAYDDAKDVLITRDTLTLEKPSGTPVIERRKWWKRLIRRVRWSH
jgi:hypothetical protein